MNRLLDREGALTSGLAAIRAQFAVPTSFPAGAAAVAELAAKRPLEGFADWTNRDFVTLDPATSTDLDQAFAIERAGKDVILHYAIADVAWFVRRDDPVDLEAWARGTTIYLPDGKASLYPPSLSEGAASLLPDVDRPATVFTVRVDEAGKSSLEGAVPAIIRSRAKLAYEAVKSSDLPLLAEFSSRIRRAEDARGAARVDEPEQELVLDSAGHYVLDFRPQLEAEKDNAALSLAANLAIADVLLAHRTGLFRIMPKPDERAVRRLRHTAKALGLDWPRKTTLAQFACSLDSSNPRHLAFRAAMLRAGPKASYSPYREGIVPWHSAMAATYAQATAPLRRLADRYVIEAALRIANGQPIPAELEAVFQRLPPVMAKAEEKADQVARATLDLAEAIMLEGCEGSRFDACVTDVDERGTRIQLLNSAVIARIDGKGAMPGDDISVELTSVDVGQRQIRFQRVA